MPWYNTYYRVHHHYHAPKLTVFRTTCTPAVGARSGGFGDAHHGASVDPGPGSVARAPGVQKVAKSGK